MRIHYFATETHASCADGSPSAIYSNHDEIDRDPGRHVFFVMGGGACVGEADCQNVLNEMPYKVSSDTWPKSVEGMTILSSNSEINPLAHNYTHWLLPYCTQDAYLGTGSTDANGLIKTGSLHLTNGFRYWLEQIKAPPEELLIIGGSAGGLGILNHMEYIFDIGKSAGIKKMRIVLDSSPLSGIDASPSAVVDYVHSHVNLNTHPSCYLNDEMGVPCCLSTHCMMRNDPSIAKWSKRLEDQRLLLINSMYDPYEISKKVNFGNSGGSIGDYVKRLSSIDSNGGKRQQQLLETVNQFNDREIATNSSTNKLVWVHTSCVMHSLLVPSSFDSETVDCYSGDKVCRDNTVGVVSDIYRGQKLIIWNSPDLWETECVNGQSIRSLLSDFVAEQGKLIGTGKNKLFSTFGDVCIGPNCDTSNRMISPCQQFLELQDSFGAPVSSSAIWFMTILLVVGSIFGYFVRFRPYLLVKQRKQGGGKTLASDNEHDISDSSDDVEEMKEEATLAMKGLSVKDPAHERWLLRDVSFSLPVGEVTAICGRSGSGKTTLLRAMVGQTPKNLTASVQQSNFDCFKRVCYLRQDDNCGNIKKMKAGELLKANSLLYGATSSRLCEVQKNIAKFKDTCVNDLSGGEKRRLAVCSALLLKPKLMVLDEALSGLDSVSSLELLDFIIASAKETQCSVVISIHTPSDEMARRFQKLMIMEGGRIIMNGRFNEFWANSNTRLSRSESIHRLIQSEQPDCLSERSSIIDDEFEVVRPKKVSEYQRPNDVTVSLVLLARLVKEYGLVLTDFVRLPITFIILSMVLSWDDGSMTQVIIVTMFSLGVPFQVYRYKISQSCKIWKMHRYEVLDGRVSFPAYMIATNLYQISPAVLALLPSLAIAYALLGWTFATFLVQYIFCSLFLIVSLGMGRVLCLLYDGDHTKFSRPFSLFVILNFLFSGAVVPISKFPPYFKWLYTTSYTFWATSGATLNQLRYGEPIGEYPCTTAITCVMSDNSILARYLGYIPLTTVPKSILVLILLYVMVLVTEFFTGAVRSHGKFAKLKREECGGDGW